MKNGRGCWKPQWILLMLLCTTIGATGCTPSEIDITISQDEVQQRIAPKFPLKKSVLIAEVSLHTPVVYFEGEKIGVKLAVDAMFLQHPLKGNVDLRASIRYDANTGAFFAENVEIVDVHVADNPAVNLDQLKALVAPLVSEALQNTPLYTLPDDTARQRLTGKLLRNVTVKDSALIATFGV